MFRRRAMRWLAVGTLVAVGVFFALDFVALRFLESSGRAQLVRAVAAEEASLDLGNVPFLPGFITGHLSRVEVEIEGATASGGLRVQRFTARLSDVDFSWGRVFALARSRFAGSAEISGVDPFASIEFHEDDLETYFRQQDPTVGTVDVSGSGIEVRFKRDPTGDTDEDNLTEPARFLPRVQDGRLSLRLVGSAGVPSRYRSAAEAIARDIPIPQLPSGLRPDVKLASDVFTVEVAGQAAEFTLGTEE